MEDIWKPTYHFTPPKNWMNDPNGLIYSHGQYHLFYQHNPNAPVWGDIHWGHAVSADLVHWRHLPVALAPTPEWHECHCYSGSIVMGEQLPTLFYTSIGTGAYGPEAGARQRMAVSHDGLMTWVKQEQPAIPYEVHGGLDITYWRDPFVFQHHGVYWAVLSGTHDGSKGCILLYQSKDLMQWEFLGIVYETDRFPLLECPNLIPMTDDRFLLLYSPVNQIHYHIGTLGKDYSFQTESSGIFDGGSGRKGYYAPNTYTNLPDGRRVVMGWLSDHGRMQESAIQGWAGVQSLPREITLHAGELHVAQAREVWLLRRRPIDLGEGTPRTRAFEWLLHLDGMASGSAEITLLESPDGQEKTVLTVDGAKGRMEIDRRQSSRFATVEKTILSQPIPLVDKLEIDLFLDHSVIEVFVNRQVALSGRVYPSREDAVGTRLVLRGDCRVMSMEAWEMEAI